MLQRTALALLLLLPPAAAAQDQGIETARLAVVQISGTRNGATVRGSGFVVGLDHGQAMIVTASHVIAGVEKIEVTFAADLTQSFPAAGFLRMDAESPRGPAVLQVRGSLPAEVTTLSFEVEQRPRIGTTLFLLGFPVMATSPRTTQRVLSDRDGTSLLIDQGIGEGFSGGPVLQDGKVVGVVTGVDDQTTYAVEAVVVRAALDGWGVKLGSQGGTSPSPPSTTSAACIPGQTDTVDGITYVRICPGTFTMGSAANDPQAFDDEKPAHEVTLSEEFWLGQTEVTNAQYRRIQPDLKGKDRLPADHMLWVKAKQACERFGGRLPTEAEWEYAARAGSTTTWSFGSDEAKLSDYAWYDKNARLASHPVAMKKPNAWGLYDMYGNVWEWVADREAAYTAAAQRDPAGPAAGEWHIRRGGAFGDQPRLLRSASRSGFELFDQLLGAIGFRCARAPRRQP